MPMRAFHPTPNTHTHTHTPAHLQWCLSLISALNPLPHPPHAAAILSGSHCGGCTYSSAATDSLPPRARGRGGAEGAKGTAGW